MGKILKVQVWIYFEANDGSIRVLLLKTNPDRGAFWQPVTGSVEPGEDILSAAVRESDEETGVQGLSLPEPIGYEFEYVGRWGPARETVFRMKIDAARATAVRLDPSEHIEFRWVNPKEVMSLVPHDEVRLAFLKAFASYL